MGEYILIGCIVQILICIIRVMRGVVSWSDLSWNWMTVLTLVIGGTLNILLWPITIIVEIINTIRGI